MSDAGPRTGRFAWSRRPGVRWGLAILIVVIASTTALWPRGAADDDTRDYGWMAYSPLSGAPSARASPATRAAANLAPCPATARPVERGPLSVEKSPPAVDKSPLRGITLSCLADGKPVELAAALAGRPAVLNLWAYWCGPCADELPHLRDFAARAARAVTVLTVHSDPDELRSLARLTDLDVRLPGVQDDAARVRAAVGAPSVLPVSVLVRADGTIAKVIVRPFTGVDDIAATVAQNLGVTV